MSDETEEAGTPGVETGDVAGDVNVDQGGGEAPEAPGQDAGADADGGAESGDSE